MLPAFEAVSVLGEAQKDEFPLLSHAINSGLQKLSEYKGLARNVPAYMLAMVCLFWILTMNEFD